MWANSKVPLCSPATDPLSKTSLALINCVTVRILRALAATWVALILKAGLNLRRRFVAWRSGKRHKSKVDQESVVFETSMASQMTSARQANTNLEALQPPFAEVPPHAVGVHLQHQGAHGCVAILVDSRADLLQEGQVANDGRPFDEDLEATPWLVVLAGSVHPLGTLDDGLVF